MLPEMQFQTYTIVWHWGEVISTTTELNSSHLPLVIKTESPALNSRHIGWAKADVYI